MSKLSRQVRDSSYRTRCIGDLKAELFNKLESFVYSIEAVRLFVTYWKMPFKLKLVLEENYRRSF
jgi:hypothetical protein